MDFKTFLEHFDTIAQAPNGIAKLRSLILNLAMRGNLVPQNPDDEPASTLISRIQDIRKQNRRRINTPSVLDEKINLQELPKSWTWCRVEQIATVCLGSTPSRKEPTYWDGNIPWVSSGEVANCRIKSTKERITDLGLRNSSARIYPKETVLIAIIGQGKTRGQSAILDIEACTNQNVAGLVFDAGNIFPDYVWKWALSEYEQTRSGGRGGAQPALNGQKIRDLLVPLPPLTEQKRIVEKVDELMAMCDRLQASQETRDNLRQNLRKSAIASLMNAETDEELQKSWSIVRDNWQTLSQKPEDVGDLRRSILQLAVRGNLVSQDSKDKSASEISRSIREEYHYLLSQKVINSNRLLSLVEPEEYPFNLPYGWTFERLGNLVDLTKDITYGIIKLGQEPKQDGVKTLRCSDVLHRRIDISRVRSVEQSLSQQYSRTILEGGEIVMNIRGTLGGCAVVPAECKGYNIAREVAVIPINSYANNRYILDVISSPLIQENVIQNLRGIAYKGLNLSLLRQFVIPLPPIDEQKRIVAKVDELMQMCDRLEESLRQSQQWVEALAASAISHLTV